MITELITIFKIALLSAGTIYISMMIVFIIAWIRLKTFNGLAADLVTTVSIIIPARNEEDAILDCLEDILKQQFPSMLMEVIIVNDNSTDNTAALVETFISKARNVSSVNFQMIALTDDGNTNAYKKKAITEGISRTSGKLIITTDADCRMNSLWLSTIVSYFEKHRPDFISAPVSYQNEKNWFGKFQTLEFLGLIGIGAASIKAKVPAMCNGANLAYTRKVFNDVGGFESINKLASGDDTFLMLKIAEKHNTGIHFLKSFDAIVYTTPKASLGEFIQQRKRWASKGTQYNSKKVILIGLITYLFNFLILASGVFSIIYNTFAFAFCMAIITKITVELIFLFFITSFFKRRELLWYFFQEQLLYIFYVVWIGADGTFSKYKWKDRVVK